MLAMLMMLQVAAMGAEAPPIAEIEPAPGAWAREAAAPKTSAAEKEALFLAGAEATKRFRNCMSDGALLLHKGRDSADVVARAIRIKCSNEEKAFVDAFVKSIEYGTRPQHGEREITLGVAREFADEYEQETLLKIVEIRAR